MLQKTNGLPDAVMSQMVKDLRGFWRIRTKKDLRSFTLLADAILKGIQCR